MKSFQLPFAIPSFRQQIKHGDKILFLGSCFSDEMADKARFVGLDVNSNPFGTIFHPLVLAELIDQTISEIKKEEKIFQRDDVFLSWDTSSTVYDMNEEGLKEKLNSIRSSFRENLKNGKFLFVTFGTAWGYELIQTGKLVANCHKIPQSSFQKHLASIERIVGVWSKTIHDLKTLNPDLEIIFTVSPVRHTKDGLVENNRSKAILIESIRKLEELKLCSYFPSYEIVLDVLRDYRFFEKDLAHPNELAVDFVWENFENCFCSDETKSINSQVSNLNRMKNHRLLFPESAESRQYSENLLQKEKELLNKFPKVII